MFMSADGSETGRVEAFSDGVFAIAITLLVLDLKVPRDLPPGTTLLHALLAQWPSYVAFVTSFATIGIMWINHHTLFTLIKRTDHTLLNATTAGVGVPCPAREDRHDMAGRFIAASEKGAAR